MFGGSVTKVPCQVMVCDMMKRRINDKYMPVQEKGMGGMCQVICTVMDYPVPAGRNQQASRGHERTYNMQTKELAVDGSSE